jgi:hypothetical protein
VGAPRVADLWAPPRHPYVIWATPFTERSSGVYALHVLCHALSLVGEDAYVATPGTNPAWRTPLYSPDLARQHISTGRVPIAVYPEVVAGNPLRADVVARFILNQPGLLGGDSTYPPSELLFAYSPEFVPRGMEADRLTVPVFDLRVFRPAVPDAERSGRYFFSFRHRKNGGVLLPDTDGCTELSMERPVSLAKLGELFGRAELLYSYERSAICTEAMLSGCPVVYLPTPQLTEFPCEAQLGRDGAAWGNVPDEVARARATVGKMRARVEAMQAEFWPQLERFVARTQRAADAAAGRA